MKVHFVGALHGDKLTYTKIMDVIEKLGYEVVTRHSAERDLRDVEKETPEEAELYVKKMTNWIKKADVIVFEATTEGVGTGYEIAIALNLGKPVIVLYKRGHEPHVLKGQKIEKLQTLSYNDVTLKEILKETLEDAKEQMDVRFNFFISPKIGVYLDWIAKNKKLPRAVFLRKLIEEDMKKNKDFKRE